jgi:hypothetical protein
MKPLWLMKKPRDHVAFSAILPVKMRRLPREHPAVSLMCRPPQSNGLAIAGTHHLIEWSSNKASRQLCMNKRLPGMLMDVLLDALDEQRNSAGLF